MAFGQEDGQTNSVIKNQQQFMSRPTQRLEGFRVAAYLSRVGPNRGTPMLHDAITDMGQRDRVIAKQCTVTVAMECHVSKPLRDGVGIGVSETQGS